MNLQKLLDYHKRFRDKGWMPGGCGALAQLFHITETSKKVYVTPDIPRLDQLTTNDLFVLRSLYGKSDVQNPLNQTEHDLKISRWTPIFLEVFSKHPNARCVAQLSTKWGILSARVALAAWRKSSSHYPNVLRLAHWGLLHHLGADKELLIPIIDFSSKEKMEQDAKSLLDLYPETCAILIRDYGVITWADSLEALESRTELLEHVMELESREFDTKLQLVY